MHAMKNSNNNPMIIVNIKMLAGALTGLLLGEAAVLSDVVAEIAARHQVDHEVEVLTVLKGAVHVDQEPVTPVMLSKMGSVELLTGALAGRGTSFRSLPSSRSAWR